MAKKKEQDITDVFDDNYLKGIEKKFDSYHKWEDSADLDAIGNKAADVWEKEFYQKTAEAIEKVTGGKDKKLDFEKHEEKLKGELADIMLGYLEKTHGMESEHTSKHDKVQFHEMKEVIKNQKLKGRALYDVVSNIYDNHINHNPRDKRKASINQIIDTALAKGIEGEKLQTMIRKRKEEHIDGITEKYTDSKWREHVGDIHPTEARMYMRKHVLPSYDAKIDNHQIFNMQDEKSIYKLWKGFKHGEEANFKEEHGVEYKPVLKPQEKK